ncbi:MAG: hypothetical protein H5U08_13330 [Thermogutta sp.]|uniref:hypothetical protein n=1 Tax=Thermogutta sp. TaxID=1962930 RepID=UPI00198956C5|nr:hypothetical protein [Thermogutta sp.]MBC7353339.1 hypothetical protein [Thermogutta sp.]
MASGGGSLLFVGGRHPAKTFVVCRSTLSAHPVSKTASCKIRKKKKKAARKKVTGGH